LNIRRGYQLTGRLIIWVSLASVTTAHAEGTNIVPNPGFEEENETKRGTPRDWVTPYTNAFWTTNEAHSGKYSIELKISQLGKPYYEAIWTSPEIPVKGDINYKFSFWAKCPETSRFSAMAGLIFYDKDTKRIKGARIKGAPLEPWPTVEQEGPFDWHKFSRLLRTPTEACYVMIVFQFYRSVGCVYYDDVSLVAQE
jgi:hypothetical protein